MTLKLFEFGWYGELSANPFGNPDVSITEPQSTLTQQAYNRIWPSQYQYIARRVGDRFELGFGIGSSQSQSPLPRSTLYFGLDVARGFLDSTLEIRATVDKDIPLPYTPATISGSEGAYLEIEDFGDKVVVVVLTATFIGVGALAGSAIRAGLVTMAEAIALRISLFLSGGR